MYNTLLSYKTSLFKTSSKVKVDEWPTDLKNTMINQILNYKTYITHLIRSSMNILHEC